MENTSNTLQNKNKLNLNISKNATFFSYIALFILIIISGIVKPGFFKPSHIFTVFQQAAPLIIVAIAQTLVMLTGGIDLTVGTIVIFTDVIAAGIMLGDNHLTPLAILVCLLLGAILGSINGMGIVFLEIPPLVMTLAASLGIKGILYLYTGGVPRGGASPFLKMIGSGKIGIFPNSIFIWFTALILAYFVLRKTIFGWKVYFMGDNTDAAHAMGMRNKVTTILVYSSAGLLYALAGLIVLGYVGIPSFVLGDDYTMNSIAAAVVGGVSFAGGTGSIFGALSGALIIRFIFALLTAFNISAAGKNIIQGVIIIVMVAVLTVKNKRN